MIRFLGVQPGSRVSKNNKLVGGLLPVGPQRLAICCCTPQSIRHWKTLKHATTCGNDHATHSCASVCASACELVRARYHVSVYMHVCGCA